MPDLGPAVQTTLTRCLAVVPGEDVLVVVDPKTQPIGEALRDGARALGAETTLAVMDERATHGAEPLGPIAAALAACDVFIAPTTKSLSHTAARRHATDAGARGATMPGVTEDILARVMAGDFQTMGRALARRRQAAERRRSGASHLSARHRCHPRAHRPRRGPELLAQLRAHGALGTNLAELGVGTNDAAVLSDATLAIDGRPVLDARRYVLGER